MKCVPPMFFIVAAATLIGCSSTANTPPPSIPEGMTAACVDGKLTMAAGFRPGVPVDFVGFRRERTVPQAVVATSQNPNPSGNEAAWTATFSDDKVGTPCATASDQAACTKAFASFTRLGSTCQGMTIVPAEARAADPAPAPAGFCNQSYWLYTRGDEIGVIDTIEKARVFLGTIDAPQEAFLLLQLGGDSLYCSGLAPVASRPTGDGYDIQTSGVDDCNRTLYRDVINVSRAGKVQQFSKTVMDDTCH